MDLRTWMRSKNYTQKGFCEYLGINRATLYNWMKGRRYPRVKYYILMYELHRGKVTSFKDCAMKEK